MTCCDVSELDNAQEDADVADIVDGALDDNIECAITDDDDEEHDEDIEGRVCESYMSLVRAGTDVIGLTSVAER